MSESLEQSRQQRLREAAEHGRRAGVEGAGNLEEFLLSYYRHVAAEDVLSRAPEDLLGAALSHRSVARHRPSGTANVEVFNPDAVDEGWSSGHTVIQVVTDDMPFLVDSLSVELTRQGRAVHLVVHPQLRVRRSATGDLEEVMSTGSSSGTEGKDGTAGTEGKAGKGERSFGEGVESWMHLEVDRDSDAESRAELASRLRRVLTDVREAVEDWRKMRDRAREVADELAASPPAKVGSEDVEQTVEFLRWMAENHFTFLGFREYELRREERGDVISAEPGTGLGILRRDPSMRGDRPALSQAASRKARERELLIVTKANSRATVHRSTYLDYVGVKTFDADGTVTGEHRFLGLFTSSAYTESVLRVPIVKDKVRKVLDASGFSPDSHSGKDLLEVLENFPRDELLQTSVDRLLEVSTSVVHLQERRRTKLYLRTDDFLRFVSCLVYIPRDRYNTTVRLKMQAILKDAFDGATVDYTTRVSESSLAQLHFVVRVPQGEAIPEVDTEALEKRLVDASRTWDEDLAEAARAEHGEEEAARLAGVYGRGFPEAYKESFTVRQAIADLVNMEELSDAHPTGLALYQPTGGRATDRRFKLYRREPITLTEVLPLFTHMGVEVVDERPYEIRRGDGGAVYVYDFGLRVHDDRVWSSMSRERVRELFEGAVGAVWDGRAESDGFNALVLGAHLDFRQVVILRAIAKYLRQGRQTFSQHYLQDALIHNLDIAAKLVELFETRFDPDRFDSDEGARAEAEEKVATAVTTALDEVSSLDEDRIVRAFLGVIRATLRTNYFQTGEDGQPKSYVSFKIDPKKVPDLPAPRPAFEIWVYSPRVEGVHLRFGAVARGGLRWSDRREDFRTEVLGLVKAQMVKNAVIVPTGSKGGFFAKQLPDPTADRDAWLKEGVAAYTVFISAMLDVTDNRDGTEIVPPDRVVRHDGDDSYLVVAADKGTATFSDIANGISRDYGFWLDDAFASGGSEGYDHKAMGITARGAWEAVKRHFRELGVDTQNEEFTVVGVGDMSGDVFGNGMLLSEHIRLVAAFDHRHIFVDPTPDAKTSYDERRRLFDLDRSSWADYDTSLISEGGGVFSRSAKSVKVTPQMVEALGLEEGTEKLTPAELLRGILLSPVDLLWNGGIGTYVKSARESHGDVGDRANDAIRVDGADLRVKVVGEGGNLGLTQLGRIEASLHGVAVNTDAIDNSAGVDTSDHEVNIKILLGQLVRDGDLTMKQRNSLLASMTDEVAAQVLRDNYEQNVLLGNARAQEHDMVSVHERFIHWLEENGELDRSLEYLPGDPELHHRAEDGIGLRSPEVSVMVAYAKLALKDALLPSDLPDDPWFRATLTDYFPEEVRDRFGDELSAHPLRREIITNSVANSMVNRGGITFAFRAAEETGASAVQIARAFVICREVFNLQDFVAEVEELDNVVSTGTQTRLYLEFRRLLDRGVRWFLGSRPSTLDVASEVERFRPTVVEYGPKMDELLVGSERERLERNAASLTEQGVPERLAVQSASLLDRFSLLDVVDVCHDTGEPAEEIAPLYFAMSEKFHVDSMLGKVTRLPREDRWDSLARGALRDDLYSVLESLVRSVLETTPESDGLTMAQRYRAWEEANHDALERMRRSLSGIERLENPNIAALSVALRTLRSVVKSGSAT